MAYYDLSEAQKIRARAASKKWKQQNPGITKIQEQRRREKMATDSEYAAKRRGQHASNSARDRANRPEEVKSAVRRSTLKRKYGVTLEWYDGELVKYVACPICGSTVKPHLDHNHITGRVREFICPNCNKALGLLAEDPERMKRMMAYVRKHRKGA